MTSLQSAARPLCVSIWVLLAAGAPRAETLRVPQDFESIQAAVDVAQEGDVILISAGSYDENVALVEKIGVELRGKGAAVIRGGLDEGVPGGALSLTGCSNVTLTSLRFQDFPANGILVLGSQQILVQRCRFLNGGLDAIQVLQSDDVTISKCRIETMVEDGLQAREATDLVVEKTRVMGVGEDGVEADDSVGVTVDKCRIEDAGRDGIRFSIEELTTTDDAVVTRNKIKRCDDDGIDHHGNDGFFEKNDVRDVDEDGLENDGGSGNVFLKNKVRNAGDKGIVLDGVGTTVDGNLVQGAQDDGIRVRGAMQTVTNNRVQKAEERGICVEAALIMKQEGNGTHVLQGNQVVRAGEDGIVLESDAPPCHVESNSIKTPGLDGIHVLSSLHELLTNTVSKAGQNGFHLEASGNTVTGNKAKGSLGFDLQDLVGGNTYMDNVFKTENVVLP